MKDFYGKVAAITGAGSGMGQALAVLLAKEGCHVAISDINPDELEQTAAMIDSKVNVSTHVVDVADRVAVKNFANAVVQHHGKVNMIFNNAGVSVTDLATRMSLEDFEWLMDINFWGVVYGTRAFLPLLSEQPEAHIINTSSIFGTIAVPSQSAYNASTFAVRVQVQDWFAEHKPNVVFLAAAKVGGILANDTHPVDFLQENLKIELNIIESAYRSGVEKLVFLGSSCIYPKFADQPINEDALLTGALEPTNEWYAIAKIAGIKLCQAYRKQYGANFISAMPCNLYGVNDNFDLQSSHVIPALMRKAHQAKLDGTDMEVWGSGTPLREFLYADDAASAIVHLSKFYDGYSHVNVGYGEDVTIRELAETICQVVGFEGALTFDSSKPDGTPKKLMDVSLLKSLGWQPQVDLARGLALTYEWFLQSEHSKA